MGIVESATIAAESSRSASRSHHLPRGVLLLGFLSLGCGDDGSSATGETPTSTSGITNPSGTTGGDATTSTTSTTGTTAIDSSADGSTSGSTTTGDSSADGPPIFDLGLPDAPPPPEAEPWLLHLGLVGNARHLFQIDIETAAVTDLCTVIDAATMMPLDGSTTTLTFSREDRLFFTRGANTLWEMELPSCIATEVGPIGISGINGISPDEGNNLYGLSSDADVLISIDVQTGVGTVIGPFGIDWGSLGGTWNEDEQQILGINSIDDALYEVSQVTGTSTQVLPLPLAFGSVGMEYHPLTGRIYACTNDSHLYRLEDDGSLTDLGDMGFSNCDNLGAPWSPDVPLPEG